MDVFGTGVAISGDYVAVGAPYENEHGYQSGAIYVFHREGTTWTETSQANSDILLMHMIILVTKLQYIMITY